jgi:glucoamylase
VWDAPDIPGRELFRGDASGSARPLVWAHAEYIKLRRSIEDGRIFDQPPQTVQRYLVEKRSSTPYAVWRFNNKIRTMTVGNTLRVETLARATVHWGIAPPGERGPRSNEGSPTWHGVHDVETVDTGLGVYVADLDTRDSAAGSHVMFTFFWHDAAHWEDENFRVAVRQWG